MVSDSLMGPDANQRVTQSAYITIFGTLFLCWAAQEIMERKFGMSPAIRRTTSLHDVAAKAMNPKKTHTVVNRLTKQLDNKGRFRIQTRGTIYYIKGVWNILMWGAAIVAITWDEHWFYNHFVELDPKTAIYYPYTHVAASILAFYSWEMCANRYAKLNWSIMVHHWLTSLAALLILLGNFNPFATWYGFTAVQSVFPIWFILGLRATFSQQYPELTRKGFIFAFWWYLMVICANMSGQVFLVVNGLITGRIAIWNICLIIVAISGWMFDDIQLLRSLYDFSTHNYEDADLFSRKRTARELGGRSLFAKSIIMDLGEFEKSKSNSSNNPYKSQSGHHLSPEPKGQSDDENETEQVPPSKHPSAKHLEQRYETENKIVTEMQIRLNNNKSLSQSNQSNNTTQSISPKIVIKEVGAGAGTGGAGSGVDSDVELIKQRDSFQSTDLKAIAMRYKEKGTFHSTTEKITTETTAGGTTALDPLPPTQTDHDHSTAVFARAGSGVQAGTTEHELGLQALAKSDTTQSEHSKNISVRQDSSPNIAKSSNVKRTSGNVNSLHGSGNYAKGTQSNNLGADTPPEAGYKTTSFRF